MYHGDTNERQRLELHMVRKEEGMDQWLLAVTSDPAAKGSAKDLEVAGAGPVHCHFSFPPTFLTMCSSKHCLSFELQGAKDASREVNVSSQCNCG